ncbi:hypothetical protein ACFOLD_01450 [Kocuria carniphila]|uniref:hypothetical protein n=1 Tax=Kocuria carniphila TaxID=262208 RepID=UPI003620D25D
MSGEPRPQMLAVRFSATDAHGRGFWKSSRVHRRPQIPAPTFYRATGRRRRRRAPVPSAATLGFRRRRRRPGIPPRPAHILGASRTLCYA